ncbi:MAG TPA: hypothetical protein VI160_08700 [Gemmatimonadales bacterium]
MSARWGGWALVAAGGWACAAGLHPGQTIPQALRHYEVLVEGRDSTARALADAFHRRGFKVRDHVRGGGRPTLAYVATPYRGDAGARLAVQLADTRRGLALAAADFPADSLKALAPPQRAEWIVTELLTAAGQARIP